MIKKILIGVAALLAALIVVLTIDFFNWRHTQMRSLAQLLKTVEIDGQTVAYTDIGEGEPILFVFGGGSGPDDVLEYQWLVERGYRMISVNRSGYLGMPIERETTFASEADTAAAVLNALGVPQAHVMGVSMGGAPALFFAARHPEMTRSVVLWSAVTRQYIINTESSDTLMYQLVMSPSFKDVVSWMLARSAQLAPEELMLELLRTESSLDEAGMRAIVQEQLAEPDAREEFVAFINSLTPMSQRFEGMMFEVDLAAQNWEAEIPDADIPLFSARSTLDTDVPISMQQYLIDHWPNGQFVQVEAGGHFCYWGREGQTVRDRTVEFLRQNRIGAE